MKNDSGIKSLAGFSYQIKVFILKSAQMRKNNKIEFETIDDIALKKIKEEDFDEKDSLNTLVHRDNEKCAVQVKKTKISSSVAEKILFNWLLLKNENIGEYRLVTDSSYRNEDIFSLLDFNELYIKILNSDKKKSALITKVKNIYKKDKKFFLQDCNNIKDKYCFEDIEDIDQEISDQYEIIFKKAAVSNNTYERRISQLFQIIIDEILQQINNGQPYVLEYQHFMKLAEEVCRDVTDDRFLPDYASFKNTQWQFNQLKIAKTREYKQLKKCNINQILIDDYLCREQFYKNYKYNELESGRESKINGIEEESYINFLTKKAELQSNQNDTPANRLFGFYNQPNSHIKSSELKVGSGVYLTRDKETKRQISWEDESNGQK